MRKLLPIVLVLFASQVFGAPLSIAELRKRAEAGEAVAQFELGILYRKGEGVPQSYEKALNWYLLAAKQGHPDAQNSLGVMHVKGLGVPQDYKEAFKWFMLSAEQGFA